MRPKPQTFLRHPTGMPLGYRTQAARKTRVLRRTVLRFECGERLRPGTLIEITIPAPTQSTSFVTKVLSCDRTDNGYEAGVGFLSRDDVYRARMVEQVCHIEAYRAKVQRDEGRQLSRAAAAEEWIPRYAARFP